MELWERYRLEQLVAALRRAGFEVREAHDLLAEHLREGVTPQTPDPGPQLSEPPPANDGGGSGSDD